MIYYISDLFKFEDKRIECLTTDKFKNLASKTNLYGNSMLGLDVEASGLDFYSEMLLLGLSTELNQYIFDYTSFHVMSDILDSKTVTIIGHNLKYDYQIIKTNLNKILHKTWDTMIADQRLYQGFGRNKNNPMGIRFDLDNTVYRHCRVNRQTNKEETRENFIGKKQKNYIPVINDIIYLSEDIKNLIPTTINQVKLVKKYNLTYQQSIEQQLVKVLAEAELEGIDFDVEKWKENIKFNKDKTYYYSCLLDDFIRNNIEQLPLLNQTLLKHWFKSKRYVEPEILNLDLFGNEANSKTVFSTPKSKKLTFNTTLINWSSSEQIIKVLSLLELPVPTKENLYLIPVFKDNKLMKKDNPNKETTTTITKQGKKKVKVTNKYLYFGISPDDYFKCKKDPNLNMENFYRWTLGFTVGVPSLLIYKKTHKEDLLTKFTDLYEEYINYETKITNFGQNYIDKVHPKTGRIHTIYRQSDATSGRLQSGGGKKQPDKFNSQNVPAEERYRRCFIAPDGWSLITSDLSGAEGVIITDKSNDPYLKLMLVEKDDIHSPVSTACWKNIFLFRAMKAAQMTYQTPTGYVDINTAELFWKHKHTINDLIVEYYPKAKELYNKSKTFNISKKENKNLRDEFKASLFAIFYGGYADTIGKQLNIPREEGQIVLDTIKQLMPKAFEMLERNVNFVFGKYYKGVCYEEPNGFIVTNSVFNSRLYVPQVIDCIKNNQEVDFYVKKDHSGTVRNNAIQGTQADMLKVGMVKLDNFIKKHNLKAKILLQVHDELVVKCEKRIDGISDEFKSNPLIIDGKPLDMGITVRDFMVNAANQFLTNVKMKAEYNVGNMWKK